MENSQGGHELLHLHTNKVVKHQNLTKILITPSIIKQVHALATLEYMPQGLKTTNKTNNMILYSAWIAGLDYYKEIFEDDKYEEEEDTNDEDNDAGDYEHYKMDENELADILQETNNFQVPHETEEREEFF